MKKLNEIIVQEQSTSIETLGGYIVGEILGDYEKKYVELNKTNSTVQRIGDLASDIEISNGSLEELQGMWTELKQLVGKLGTDK